ncbi:MAG TPA: CsbD family protein [Candidatus Limnocylindria bacterium]|nr:CsbD family protein [Candidatus Limnocylindria bacterium]
MDTDRIEGPVKEAGGKVKEEWGDATDDASTEAEGKAEQVEGKLQNEWGETKDEARDIVDDDR